MLANVRLELARAQLADVTKRVKAGAIDVGAARPAEDAVRRMELAVQRTQLNITETLVSAQPPRDELNAPLVNGRDFVKERIQLDLMAAQQQLIAAEASFAGVDNMVQIGAVPPLARIDARLEVAQARRSLALLAERLTLRREFIEKGTPVEQLATRLETTQLRENIRVAQQSLDLATTRAQTLERQRAVGQIEELDVLRAQLEVKERQVELYLLTAQLRRLGAVRRDTLPQN
jgi:hypothetical protein